RCECAPADLVRLGAGRPRHRGRDRDRHPRRRPAHRHVPLERRRRPAREQDRLRSTSDAPAVGHRRGLPERALAAQEQGHGDEDPEGASLRARDAQAAGEDGADRRHQERHRLRPPDPLVRAASVPDGEGPSHEHGGGQRRRRPRRRPRSVRRRLAAGAAGRWDEEVSGTAADRARAILAEARAMITGSHVVYTSGKHGSAYVNKDAVYPSTARVAELCRFLADATAPHRPEVVCGPAMGGIILAQWTGHHLGLPAVYAEKTAGGMALRRGYDKLVAGRRVLVVEDILNT